MRYKSMRVWKKRRDAEVRRAVAVAALLSDYNMDTLLAAAKPVVAKYQRMLAPDQADLVRPLHIEMGVDFGRQLLATITMGGMGTMKVYSGPMPESELSVVEPLTLVL